MSRGVKRRLWRGTREWQAPSWAHLPRLAGARQGELRHPARDRRAGQDVAHAQRRPPAAGPRDVTPPRRRRRQPAGAPCTRQAALLRLGPRVRTPVANRAASAAPRPPLPDAPSAAAPQRWSGGTPPTRPHTTPHTHVRHSSGGATYPLVRNAGSATCFHHRLTCESRKLVCTVARIMRGCADAGRMRACARLLHFSSG